MKKSLLNTSAFRYIFEIIVIVFSVTLSFYIQDVLNDREKIKQKNEGLQGVLVDLNSDTDVINFALPFNTGRIKSMKEIINRKKITNKDISGTKGDLPWLGNISNYNSMISTGSVEFINDKKLFKKLNKYYQLNYKLLIKAAKIDEDQTWDFIAYLRNNYKIDSIVQFETPEGKEYGPLFYNQNQLDLMSKDYKIYNSLWDQVTWINWYNNRVIQAQREIDTLKILINNEINN